MLQFSLAVSSRAEPRCRSLHCAAVRHCPVPRPAPRAMWLAVFLSPTRRVLDLDPLRTLWRVQGGGGVCVFTLRLAGSRHCLRRAFT